MPQIGGASASIREAPSGGGRFVVFAAAAINGLFVFSLGPAAYWRFGPPAVIQVALVVAPFAALAAWRTWVYANRRCQRHESAWMGVVEAGLCGLLVTCAYFVPTLLDRGPAALPIVMVYGAAAAMLGLTLGVILRTMALVVLNVLGRFSVREPRQNQRG